MSSTRISNTTFPKIGIRKVIVNMSEIEVFCAFHRPRTADFSSWSGIDGINLLSFLNYYFLIVPESLNHMVASIYYPQGRINALRGDRLAPEWEANVEHGSLNSVKSIKKVGLLEILQGGDIQKDPISATESMNHNVEYDPSSPEGYNTFFKVIIPMPTAWHLNRAEGFSLWAFGHLDLRAITDAYVLGSSVGQLINFGGNLAYERVLEVRAGRLLPPKTRKTFIDSQGVYYTGPKYQYTRVEPHRDGYVGWTDTSPEQDWSKDSKRLRLVEVPNNKIISKIAVEEMITFGFDGYTKGSGFFEKSYGIPVDYGEMNIGEQLTRSLKATEGLTLSSRNSHQKWLKKIVQANKGSKGASLFDHSIEASLLSSPMVPLAGEAAHWKSILVLNMEELIRVNSKFTALVESHRANIEDPLATEGSRNASQDFIGHALRDSTIYNMKVCRKRLTHLPVGNNTTCTNEYEKRDIDEQEQYIVGGPPPAVSGEATRIEGLATLVAVDNLIDTPNGYKNTYILRDYELFLTGVGKYKYSVEITAEDGFKKLLLEVLTEFEDAIATYSSFVAKSLIPSRNIDNGHFVGRKLTDGLQYYRGDGVSVERHQKGSYNHITNQFTDNFLELEGPGMLAAAESLLASFTMVKFVLTTQLIFSNSANLRAATRMLAPQAGTPANFHYFLQESRKLQNILREYILKSGSSFGYSGDFDTRKVGISSGLQFPENLITVKADTGNIIDANKRFRVMFDAPHPADIPQILAQHDIQPDRYYRVELFSPPRVIPIAERGQNNTNTTTAIRSLIAALELGPGIALPGTYIDPNIMTSLDGILVANKGITFSTMLANTMNLTNISDFPGQEHMKGEILSKDFQSSIMNSLFTSDNREHFEKEMEEKYKDVFVSRESLGGLYEAVISAINIDARVCNSKGKVGFKERVLGGFTNRDSIVNRDSYQKTRDAFGDTKISSVRLNANSGADGASASQRGATSIVIQMASGQPEGAILSNGISTLPVIIKPPAKFNKTLFGAPKTAVQNNRSGTGATTTRSTRTLGSFRSGY